MRLDNLNYSQFLTVRIENESVSILLRKDGKDYNVYIHNGVYTVEQIETQTIKQINDYGKKES